MTSQPSIGRRQAGQATQNSRMVYFPMSFSVVAKEENIKGRISTAPQRALLTGLRIIDWQRLPGIRTWAKSRIIFPQRNMATHLQWAFRIIMDH